MKGGYYFLQGGITRSQRFTTEPTLEQINDFFGRVRLVTIRLKKQVPGQRRGKLIRTINVND